MYILMMSLGRWRAGCEFPVLICGGGKSYCIVRRGVTPHCVRVEVYSLFICMGIVVVFIM